MAYFTFLLYPTPCRPTHFFSLSLDHSTAIRKSPDIEQLHLVRGYVFRHCSNLLLEPAGIYTFSEYFKRSIRLAYTRTHAHTHTRTSL
jgi:hypothetical protein